MIKKGKNKMGVYNALYTNRYQYTQPPGDVKAQQYAGSGEGTKGAYFPLQGVGAGVHMMNSTPDNSTKQSMFPGIISGGPNIEKKPITTDWIGFNSFPYSQMPENAQNVYNSYLITGANERVCNPGQTCPGLSCATFWPENTKRGKGAATCLQNSDLLLVNPNKFIRVKQRPQFVNVLNAAKKK
jgi:hypothetical protein